MYRKEILHNGIVLVTEETPQFMSASVGMCVRNGSRYERDFERGVSHFIEHLLFKGTKNRSAREISTAIDAVGGILNASCGKEFTCFYAKVVDKDLPLALDLLSDMLLNSLFSTEDIEKERRVILEEINSIEDSPSDYIFDLYLKTVWNDHPLSVTTSGDKKSVLELKRENILEYFYKNYAPENMIISVAGNINHKEVLEMIVNRLGFLDKPLEKTEVSPPSFNGQFKKYYRACEQVHVCIGYPGISLRDDRRYVSIVLDNILGGTVSSRLFQKVREDLGLVYSIYSFQNSFLDTGLFSFYAATSPEKVDQVRDVILEEIEELCKSGITEEDLDLAKNYVKGGMILSLESTSSRMFRLASSELVYNRLVSIEEILEKINAVTVQDVMDLANIIFKKDNFTCCMLGPVNNNGGNN